MSNQHVVMGSRLKLRSVRYLPRFLAGSRRINQQLREAPGRVEFAVRADFRTLTFWTKSTWVDKESLHAFARSDPHASVVADLQRRSAMEAGEFSFWTIDPSEPLPSWAEVKDRVAAAVAR